MRDALLFSSQLSFVPTSELTTETLILPYSLPSIGPFAAAKGAVNKAVSAAAENNTFFIFLPRLINAY